MENLSLLLNDYYNNVNEFKDIYNHTPELLGGIIDWSGLVNSSITNEGYLIITPKTEDLKVYYEAKRSINVLVLEIHYRYDNLRYITSKIEDNYCKIKLINPIFEGVEYKECLEELIKLTKTPSFINNIKIIN